MELSKFLKAKAELPESLQKYKILADKIDLSNYHEVDILSYSLVTKKIIQLGKIQQCKTGYLPQVKSLGSGWRNLAKGQETIEQAKEVLFEKHCDSVQKRHGWSDDELAARKTEVLNAIETLKLQGWASIDEQLKAAIAKAEEKAEKKREKEMKAKGLLPIIQEIKAFIAAKQKFTTIVNQIVLVPEHSPITTTFPKNREWWLKGIYLTFKKNPFKELPEDFKLIVLSLRQKTQF